MLVMKLMKYGISLLWNLFFMQERECIRLIMNKKTFSYVIKQWKIEQSKNTGKCCVLITLFLLQYIH